MLTLAQFINSLVDFFALLLFFLLLGHGSLHLTEVLDLTRNDDRDRFIAFASLATLVLT